MKKFLFTKGIFLFLLPVFFVLHGYAENLGHLTVPDCLSLLAVYLAGTCVLYLLAYALLRHPVRACLLALLPCTFYFFFGNIYDFLKAQHFFLYRYSFLVPAFVLTCTALFFFLRKTKAGFERFRFFLNLLLLVYLLTDTVTIVWKLAHPDPNELSVYGFEKNDHYLPCKDCPDPDIYFLLFDEYSSAVALQKTFGYNNHGLDSFLVNRKFFSMPESFSNYNFTPFSMASILNMNYLSGIKDPNKISVDDYASCNTLIRNNRVIRFLSERHYSIVNYSIFDLAGHPSLTGYSLLPVKTRLITEKTFWGRFMRDIAWHFYTGPLKINWLTEGLAYENMNNNNRFIELLKEESSNQAGNPRFVYAHFEMPHPPFYFDKDLQPRNEQLLKQDMAENDIQSYAGYLPYVNKKIMDLVDTLQENTRHRAVIVVMGDHGFRMPLQSGDRSHYFQNLNAVYLPLQDYGLLKDSSSGVNQFRYIFNTLFKQSFPMLKDSTVFLTDAPVSK